jgi:hypothetical protein
MRLQKAQYLIVEAKKSMPSRSKARGQLKSINSFREVRSMTGISTHLTISPPMARSDRMPSRSFVTLPDGCHRPGRADAPETHYGVGGKRARSGNSSV